MKYKIVLLIISILILNINQAFAISYKNNINFYNNLPNGEKNTSLNIKKAKIIENALKRYYYKINQYIIRYNIKESRLIKQYNLKLNKMINTLKKIQTEKVKKNEANEVIISVLIDIKKLSKSISKEIIGKKYLNIKKTEEIANSYFLKSKVVSRNMDIIIERFLKYVNHTNNLTEYEKKGLIKTIIKIKKHNRILKKFNEITFKDKKEVEERFFYTIKKLQKEVNIIKNILKKSKKTSYKI